MKNNVVLYLFALLMSAPLYAQTVADIFSDGRILYQQELQVSDYRLILSVPKKVNSQWVFDRVESIDAQLQKKTIELSREYTFGAAKTKLENYLRGLGAQPIFICNSLHCGSSNVWANEIFRVKQLYGLDASQSYQVWQLQQESTQYLVWYLSQRGNRRIYLQLETLNPLKDVTSITPDPLTLIETMLQSRFYVVPDDVYSLKNEELLDVLVKAMNRKPRQLFAVVGHSYTERSLEGNQKKSEQLAQEFVEVLLANGIKAAQLKAIGLGSLAPQGKKGLQRLEIVVP